ncbi:helical backbone metal receptor [Dinghuibacter silviterrae]|uniref:Substrate-binding family protein n=1 Tax=Dinghuibacter silviterrae TaxID=1539049 RepID=A0A4R8DJ13_9BACT|nr:helical backbone metal receptor [Dinghuibacter silviterrae]TDW97314.1 substrate-binding family protein [Dinghuibacter silviterrae]
MRIVSLVPSLTELLFDLGLSDEVVGITKFCVHPAAWFSTKRRVGGTKNVSPDIVYGLRPDLILASKEENVREQVEALQAFARVYVTDVADLRGALAMIREVGRLTERESQASELAEEIEAEFAALVAAPVPAAYFIWRSPWMVAGGDTFISDMMAHAGFTNVYGHLKRYPTVDPAEVTGLALLSSEPYPFKEPHAAELPNARSILVDGEMFSWYGSRLKHAPAYFRALRNSLP